MWARVPDKPIDYGNITPDSFTPKPGDEVTLVRASGKRITGTWVGEVQVTAYSTPYFVMVNARDAGGIIEEGRTVLFQTNPVDRIVLEKPLETYAERAEREGTDKGTDEGTDKDTDEIPF